MRLFSQVMRGPAVSRAFNWFGIDARRYWVLMDLFRKLSLRRDMFTQLGRDDTSLQFITLLYFAMSALMSIVNVLLHARLDAFFSGSLFYTSFIVLSILLPETSNSLVNPVEGLILAHQPINGATYTAAKLSHLLRIVVYLEGGMNLAPALAGLFLKGASWGYPFLHLGAALVLGLVLALACCALFGVLIRFLPAARLKPIAQLAEIVPWTGFVLREPIRTLLERTGVLKNLGAHFGVWPAIAGGVLAGLAAAFGIWSLSGDYLVRVSMLVHGRSGRKPHRRRHLLEDATAQWFGTQPARAGFAYVARMMRRDWQFKRQVLPMFVIFLGPALVAGRELLDSPYTGRFAAAHLLPHACGLLLFTTCITLRYGSAHQASWLFLAAPDQSLGRFARGVFGLLWLCGIVVPHLVVLAVLSWFWGGTHAALFVFYSAAATSVYLALELRLIGGLPFGTQPDPQRNASLMGIVMAGGLGMAIAVGLQIFLIFHSPWTVVAAAALLGAAAYFLTRDSLTTLEAALRLDLARISGQYWRAYREVDT